MMTYTNDVHILVHITIFDHFYHITGHVCVIILNREILYWGPISIGQCGQSAFIR